MILTNRTPTPTPRWIRVALRCGAVCLLAGGLIYCTDQPDLTSVDSASVPATVDTRFGNLDVAPSGFYFNRSRPAMRALDDRIEALATEHALPIQLADALRDQALSVSRQLAEGDVAEPARPADVFLAVTPDDGTGDYRTVIMDLAGLRSALSEGPLSPEALHAELAQHLRVGQSSNLSLLKGMHFECEGAAGAAPSSYASAIANMTMTCRTVKASMRRFRVKRRR